jgi:hypothetical protein
LTPTGTRLLKKKEHRLLVTRNQEYLLNTGLPSAVEREQNGTLESSGRENLMNTSGPDFESIKQTTVYKRDAEVHKKYARYYVYALAYPDERIFYVGKGQGNRIDKHEMEARQGVQSVKCDIIRGIWAEGKEVVKRKLAFFDSENDALRHEISLISSLGGLSNIASGQKRFHDIPVSSRDKSYFGASVMQFDENGQEFYSAREVGEFLGYTSWESFNKIIQQSQKIFQDSLSLHFTPSYKIVHTGYGRKTKREIDNYCLSREALLFLASRSKLSTPTVRFGKLYIAFWAAARDGCVRKLDGSSTTYEAMFGVPHCLPETLVNPSTPKATHGLMPKDLPTADSIRAELERQRRARQQILRDKKQQQGQEPLL